MSSTSLMLFFPSEPLSTPGSARVLKFRGRGGGKRPWAWSRGEGMKPIGVSRPALGALTWGDRMPWAGAVCRGRPWASGDQVAGARGLKLLGSGNVVIGLSWSILFPISIPIDIPSPIDTPIPIHVAIGSVAEGCGGPWWVELSAVLGNTSTRVEPLYPWSPWSSVHEGLRHSGVMPLGSCSLWFCWIRSISKRLILSNLGLQNCAAAAGGDLGWCLGVRNRCTGLPAGAESERIGVMMDEELLPQAPRRTYAGPVCGRVGGIGNPFAVESSVLGRDVSVAGSVGCTTFAAGSARCPGAVSSATTAACVLSSASASAGVVSSASASAGVVSLVTASAGVVSSVAAASAAVSLLGVFSARCRATACCSAYSTGPVLLA
mmetsp:Transcript_9957/g.17592  ORF Transcript_9957/g.17592 Transcript_9957/m.17592 type:complete len:377 (+) Transcript_9957:280-1410(+)